MAFVLRKKTDPAKPGIKSDTTTLVKKDVTDPKFKSEGEHMAFYRKKAEGKLGGEDKKTYDSMRVNKGQADADAIIALRGGTPKFNAEKKAPVKITYSSKVKSGVGSGERKTSGFQYKKKLPAKGSISLIKRKNQ